MFQAKGGMPAGMVVHNSPQPLLLLQPPRLSFPSSSWPCWLVQGLVATEVQLMMAVLEDYAHAVQIGLGSADMSAGSSRLYRQMPPSGTAK